MNRAHLDPVEIVKCIRDTEEKLKKEICIGKIFGSTIFEQIIDTTGRQKYAVYEEMENQTWRMDTRLEFGNFIPLQRTPLTHPSEPTEYENEQQLYNTVKAYIYKHVDVLNPHGYDILTAFVFSTWLQELFDFTPYLGFYGRQETGKSRGLEVLKELVFRAWHTTSLTTATLYRLIEKFNPTLLIDESEFLASQEKRELIGLLNSGQRRGVLVPRMKGEDSQDFDFYNTYSPKALSGTQELRKTTTSRMIMFTMTRNIRPIPRTIDKREGLKLRNQLLMWRFRKISEMKNALTLEQKLAGRTELKAATEFKELEPLSGRLYELIFPLYYSTPAQEARNTILEFAKELEQTKLTAEKTELASTIFEAILNLKHQAQRNLILLKDIARYLNVSQPPESWIPEKTVGRKCTQMGFEKTRTNRGTAIILNQQLIERLRKDPRYSTDITRYGEESEESEPKKDSAGNWLDR